MIARKLFSRSVFPSGPKHHRAYAIGDVHGRIDVLEPLLARIDQEIADKPQKRTSIIFLGDLVDRGPASAEVVERLRTYSPKNASPFFIMGNHEEVMLRVIEGDTNLLDDWLRFGGVETLRSYGVDPDTLKRLPAAEITARLKQAVPAGHRSFLEGFADSISFGDYLFVHAGIRPGVPLAEQSQSDLRWIREPFLRDTSRHGVVVVHGHTITNKVEVTPNRIGVDTGAFCTGRLSALAIDGPERWLIQASATGAERFSLEEQAV